MANIVQPKTVVVTDSDGVARKITKIIPFSDGGVAIMVPYHEANTGWLLKMPVNYGVAGAHLVPIAESTEYSAEDRVKLTYHPSGFVQFSGEKAGKIISGLDAGKPKGLGIMTNPLSSPISSGPSFGIVAWGLSEFQSFTGGADVLTFSNHEMYHRGCKPGTQNAIAIECFVLPPRYWAGVRQLSSGELKLSMCFRDFEASRAVLDLKVIPLASNSFLGILANHVTVGFKPASGFTLNGPGESTAGDVKHVLCAIYPGTIREDLEKIASLKHTSEQRPLEYDCTIPDATKH